MIERKLGKGFLQWAKKMAEHEKLVVIFSKRWLMFSVWIPSIYIEGFLGSNSNEVDYELSPKEETAWHLSSCFEEHCFCSWNKLLPLWNISLIPKDWRWQVSKAIDTCLKTVFKSCFGAFQCVN